MRGWLELDRDTNSAADNTDSMPRYQNPPLAPLHALSCASSCSHELRPDITAPERKRERRRERRRRKIKEEEEEKEREFY